jgi:hypothetical protein
MRAFEIELVDVYDAKDCWSLSEWADTNCYCFLIVSESHVATFTGVLTECTDMKTFRNLMQINLKRWGILHGTEDWVKEITIECYMHEFMCAVRADGHDLNILRTKANLDAIRNRTNKELALKLCQRQIKKYDRSILKAAFKAWKLH